MTLHHIRAPRPAAASPAGRIIASGGPVARALQAMATGAPETERVRALRKAIGDRIEADIALLDMLGGDPDAEPSLGAPEEPAPWRYLNSQLAWASGVTDDREDDAGDKGEQENEHGGDINDEPHDAEEDDDRDSGCGDPAGAFEQYGERINLGTWAAFA